MTCLLYKKFIELNKKYLTNTYQLRRTVYSCKRTNKVDKILITKSEVIKKMLARLHRYLD